MVNLDDMLELRRKHAASQPKSLAASFSLGKPKDKYDTGKDKDGLSKEKRIRIEEIKQAQSCSYDDEGDIF